MDRGPDHNRARPARSPGATRLRRGIGVASWAYAASIVVLCGILRGPGERWWPALPLIYGPRWIAGLPLCVLIPAAAAFRPRSLFALASASALVIGPVRGVCVPWRALVAGAARGRAVRVLTCNVQHGNVDPDALGALILGSRPEIVVLQEWSARHERAVFPGGGWHLRTPGGGQCLASRYPIRAVEPLPPHPRSGRNAAFRYDIEAPGGVLYVFNLHLGSPRDGLEPLIAGGWKGVQALKDSTNQRLEESEAASLWVKRHAGPTLIVGDFNQTEDSFIYRRCWAGYRDAFATAGLGLGHTKFTRWFGVRIDHILAGPGWGIDRCWTGPDVGSDHRPVLADVRPPGPSP